MHHGNAVLTLVVMGFVKVSSDVVPVGGEFQVNNIHQSNQERPCVCSYLDGGFVVVWDGGSVFGQRFTASGVEVGSEFTVGGSSQADRVSVGCLGGGGWVVAWHEFDNPADPGTFGVFAQRFADDGTPSGSVFVVSATLGQQQNPRVVGLQGGDFIVVWQDASSSVEVDVKAQIYAPDGTIVVPEFTVNTHTPLSQLSPSVAALPGGGFVVVWLSFGQVDGINFGVFGQRFDSSGQLVGSEFQVHQTPLNVGFAPFFPRVAAGMDGSFVVTWLARSSEVINEFDVFVRPFSSTAVPIDDEQRANTDQPRTQHEPTVSVLGNGQFVVAWSTEEIGGAFDIDARVFNPDGTEAQSVFQINTEANNWQYLAGLAVLPSGFVSVWTSRQQDGDGEGVFAQLFQLVLETQAPPTVSPPTLSPPTQAPPTLPPPTASPLTEAPPTQAPPTISPPTQAPLTEAPLTDAPLTEAPLTEAPLTEAPPTQAPSTQAPPTASPPTQAPPTIAPPTQAPLTQAPPTASPLTEAPPTQAPPTQAPLTEAPPTQAPSTQAPSTASPPTQPPTVAPLSQAPSTAAPLTQAPPTAAPLTQAPSTAAPPTQAPLTQAPPTAAPLTQAPPTAAPLTQVPSTAAPLTEAPPTQAPSTRAPPTASPPTQAPPTAAPLTQAPPTAAPLTQAPPTAAPLTQAPPTEAPTVSPETHAPPTAAPSTQPPATLSPPTGAPPTKPPKYCKLRLWFLTHIALHTVVGGMWGLEKYLKVLLRVARVRCTAVCHRRSRRCYGRDGRAVRRAALLQGGEEEEEEEKEGWEVAFDVEGDYADAEIVEKKVEESAAGVAAVVAPDAVLQEVAAIQPVSTTPAPAKQAFPASGFNLSTSAFIVLIIAGVGVLALLIYVTSTAVTKTAPRTPPDHRPTAPYGGSFSFANTIGGDALSLSVTKTFTTYSLSATSDGVAAEDAVP